ncbi:hypothetical protein [Alkalibacillus haloalkaliphilus]|uniref:Uncharacterized protein n=1 Tax=Alkalibacillus haloalkaliphilus TaxID=94136 RepID=A0A511W474_9BACI|nr:hypothetical protein [Alkalibacillus haloalkaliphilus]GEN45571.1 hypothetical protein AHA02nite_13470 [Alkalibacillus haloalkaliphilus]
MRYTIYQVIVLAGLVLLAFVTEQLEAVGVSDGSGIFLYIIGLLAYMAIVVGCFSLIFYWQTKKSETFLIHPIWEKMPVIISIVFFLSAVFLIFLMEFGGYELVSEYRGLMYLLIYYFIFILNVMVVAMVYKTSRSELTKRQIIERSGILTVGVLAVIWFVI